MRIGYARRGDRAPITTPDRYYSDPLPPRSRRATIAGEVQAMKDAPERTWQDLVDIAYLFRLDGVNRDEVRQYFERAGLVDKCHELTQVR